MGEGDEKEEGDEVHHLADTSSVFIALTLLLTGLLFTGIVQYPQA